VSTASDHVVARRTGDDRPPEAASQPTTRVPLAVWVERYALLAIIVVICIFFSLFTESATVFPTAANIRTVLSNQAVIVVLALAFLFPIAAGYFNFAVASLASLCTVVTAAVMADAGLSLAAAVTASILFGGVIGAVLGVLVTYCRLNPFIVTLGAATVFGGLMQLYTDGVQISGVSTNLTAFGSLQWFGIPRILYAVAVIAAVSWYLLGATPYGRRLYAVGANPRAAHLVGMRVERIVLMSFVISGVLAGIAGVLIVARFGTSDSSNGLERLFPAVTAVLLGATAVHPGRFNVPGTLLGVLLLAVSVSGLILAGAEAWVEPVFNGTVLIVATGISAVIIRRRSPDGAGGGPTL